jgi:hypothetical protein
VVTRETATAPVLTRQNYGESDRLAESRQRGVRARAHLLEAEGGTLPVREVAERLGIAQRAVEERRHAGRLLAFPVRRIRYVYPLWQFGPHGMLPGFEEVLIALGTPNPWARAAFFLAKNVYLDGESPLAELRRGHRADVMRAAQAYGEHGAA